VQDLSQKKAELFRSCYFISIGQLCLLGNKNFPRCKNIYIYHMREGWKRCHLLRENYHSSWIALYRVLNIVSALLDSDDGKRITLIPPAILNPA